MSHELYYTSAPRGLRPGSNGYCTVTATHAMPAPLWQKLEALSDYRPVVEDSDSTGKHPIALTHLRLNILGKTWSVLSRSCMAGVDHSRRRIFFTHHVALETGELPPGGPAWLASQPGFLEMRWDGSVRELPTGRAAVMGNTPAEVCRAWKKAAGDAGWAGVLAEEFEKNPNRPVYLLYPLGLDPLPLLLESLALLPPERRWQVTFSTLYRSLPQDVACVWRCLPLEAPEARKAKSVPGALVLDLSTSLGQAEGGPLVDAARSGKAPRGTTPARVGQPAPVSGWKPSVRTAPTAEAEAEEQPAAEPEPRLTKVPEVLTPPPEPRGSSLVPFAMGLLVGVLLLGAGAVGGWRVLEYSHSKALDEARSKADEEKTKAIEDMKSADKTDKEQALGKMRKEGDAATKKAVTVALKGMMSKADFQKAVAAVEAKKNIEKDKAVAAANAAKDKERNQWMGPRNDALGVLIASLFDEKKDQNASSIKEYLEAILANKVPPKRDLKKLIEAWEDHEKRSARSRDIGAELSVILTHLEACDDLVEKEGRKKVVKIVIYGKRYKEATLRSKALAEKNTSALVRRDLADIAERLAKLPKPKPAE